MPRTVNVEAHQVRRDAFLDVAQRLIQTKGYEQMSIQDVLDELDTSKGALYHYFDSKQALLDGVVDRFADAAMTVSLSMPYRSRTRLVAASSVAASSTMRCRVSPFMSSRMWNPLTGVLKACCRSER